VDCAPHVGVDQLRVVHYPHVCYAHDMAYHRTTLLLDTESHRAARELSLKLNCSTSEAIRRAVLRYRDLVTGSSQEVRRARTQTLLHLIELSEGSDPEAEVRQLKVEDSGS
jgi:hypothetical protein